MLRFGEIVDATFSKKKYQLQGQIYPILYNVSIDPETSHKPDLPVRLCQSEKTNSAIRNKVSRTFFFLLEGWALVGFVRVAHNIEQLQMGRTQAHVGKKFLKRFNENSF